LTIGRFYYRRAGSRREAAVRRRIAAGAKRYTMAGALDAKDEDFRQGVSA